MMLHINGPACRTLKSLQKLKGLVPFSHSQHLLYNFMQTERLRVLGADDGHLVFPVYIVDVL